MNKKQVRPHEQPGCQQPILPTPRWALHHSRIRGVGTEPQSRKTSAICLPPTGCWTLAPLSANEEVELDRDEHVDRPGPETSRLEPPLGNGRHGFFIEASC